MEIVKKLLYLVTISLLLTQCKRINTERSNLTGWNFNDPQYGNFIKGKSYEGQRPPTGMVSIEGGSFTMGQVQDDVMFDWNTTPKKMHVRSFYMDEAEVTNSEYLLYLQHTKNIYPPTEEKYKHIYTSALPDTLVWRRSMGNTDLLSENYLRHPAYSNYPVVGISWLQANRYCKWRTDAVNLKILIERGHIENIFEDETIRNYFDTDIFLTDSNLLFEGDSSIYKKGVPIQKIKSRRRKVKTTKVLDSTQKNVANTGNLGKRERRRRSRTRKARKVKSFEGRKITQSDGILTQKFRLPTEVEWEYAAKSEVGNREYNTIRGRKKYAWSGKYTRDQSKKYRGDQLANFKQTEGEYSGLAGWSSDGSDIPIKIKSYPPNSFGLYDMSGNVAEWVADIYRPIIDAEANDFNYFRGNVFAKKMIDKDGKVVITGSIDAPVEYDTLENGSIVLKALPGTIKYIPITKDDAYMRRNYAVANNFNLNDGDLYSSRFYEDDKDQFTRRPRMYNSPIKPKVEIDTITGRMINKYDAKTRTTLISDRTRVYKGGSWKDREYWLDPAQRRYLPEYMATNYIGFRCATDKVGPMGTGKRTPRNYK